YNHYIDALAALPGRTECSAVGGPIRDAAQLRPCRSRGHLAGTDEPLGAPAPAPAGRGKPLLARVLRGRGYLSVAPRACPGPRPTAINRLPTRAGMPGDGLLTRPSQTFGSVPIGRTSSCFYARPSSSANTSGACSTARASSSSWSRPAG